MPAPGRPNETDNAAPHAGIASALRVVASLTLVSRVTGLARDAVCSRLFGAGPVWSAFAFAFLLPNLFRRLFGEGALAAAFLPEYSRVEHDAESARAFAGAVLRAVVMILLAVTLLGELVLLGLLMSPLAEAGGLAYRLALLTLPFAPLVCGTAVMGAMLQVRGRFAVPAATPILVNLAIIAAASTSGWIAGAEPERAILFVAAAVPLAGVLQFGLAWWRLGEHRPRLTATAGGARDRVRRTIRRMAPVAVGMSALQINALIDGLIASWPVLVGRGLPNWLGVEYPLDQAANATLFFAQRVYQFPLGVFGIALATAAFPALARTARQPRAYALALGRSARMSLLIGVPASLGLALVSAPLVRTLYMGGAFSAQDAARVTRVLIGYAPAVWAFGLTHVLTRAFYARGDTATPMRVALVSIVCNTALSLTLIWWIQEAALAWSTSVCAIGQALWLVRAESAASGRAWSAGLAGAAARILVVTLAMVGAVLLADAVITGASSATGWGRDAARLTAMVAAGAVAYLVGARAMLPAETRALFARSREGHD
ncbi:MAG: murein biosynthesis integral membrane protein MurJ [Planctomycetota bacterium]|nr:MAG: murein biosynthesis integral membrane protein MurJ [Planctomycetota bacterium]